MEFESKVSGGPEQSNLQVHLPERVANHLGLRKGDKLVWDVVNQRVEVRKKKEKP